jgi:hypothetical protein
MARPKVNYQSTAGHIGDAHSLAHEHLPELLALLKIVRNSEQRFARKAISAPNDQPPIITPD